MQNQQKIAINLKAFDHAILDQTMRNIVRILKSSGAELRGPIPMPVKKTVFTVIRGPHIHKNGREHFVRITCKRALIINNANPHMVDALNKVDLPFGVQVDFKLRNKKDEVK